MHSWKANHDEVPRLISDSFMLRIRVQDSASKFNMTGDVELDNGYSFSYQVSINFPNYF
jgi:hypothetical protein